MGNECLKTVVHTIAKSAERPSDLATRYGGEEFAVILPDLDAAMTDGTRLKHSVADLKVPRPFVTVSIGCSSLVPSEVGEEGLASLLLTADQALYRAKEAGRNWICKAARCEDCSRTCVREPMLKLNTES